MTGVLVLAAGASSRMGQPKQLLPYGESTLLRHAAQTALATGLGPVLVVLGAEAERCLRTLDGLDVRTTVNAAWAEGMGTSIATGMAELERAAPGLDGVLILLHDQPAIPVGRLVELVAARREADLVVAARYAEVTGVPAWFRRELFDELRRLHGPQGARKIIDVHAAKMHAFDLPEAALDLDTPADYERICG
jgi:molybdenum cofactor cytidylyltransferase